MKKILVLNGTISEIPIIKKAQEMGYYVVTSGNMPDLPGHKVSDEYIPEDYSDVEAILKLVKENGIEGIVSCANDFGSITASYVGEKMGWKGHDTYENALLMHHKDLFKEYCYKNNIPSPRSIVFGNIDDAIDFCFGCSYPVIVKANDLTGGKGICRADNAVQAVEAVKEAMRLSRDKKVLIEPFLEGVQQSIVVFLIDKKIAVLSNSNVYCMKNPYLVQAETYPATDFYLVEDQLRNIIETMAMDLELVDGIFSFQYIVQNGVPYVLEMMRRCFGNETLLLADKRTGYPWEEAYIRAALGLDCSQLVAQGPITQYCGHYGVMADEDGLLEGWSLPKDIAKRVFKTTVNVKAGDVVRNHMNDKIAHIYFTYEDIDTMNKEIVEFNERIRVKVKTE